MSSYLVIQQYNLTEGGSMRRIQKVIDIIPELEYFNYASIYPKALFHKSINPEEDKKKYEDKFNYETSIEKKDRKIRPVWDFKKLPEVMHDKVKKLFIDKDHEALDKIREQYNLAEKCDICKLSYSRWILTAFEFWIKINGI